MMHKGKLLLLCLLLLAFLFCCCNCTSNDNNNDSTGSSNDVHSSSKKIKTVLFVSIYFHGHLGPMLRIANELSKRADYRVYMSSQDNGHHATKENAPLVKFLAAGHNDYAERLFDEITGNEKAEVEDSMSKLFFPLAKSQYLALREQLKEMIARGERPDLIISGHLSLAGMMLATDFQIPSIVFTPGFYVNMFSKLHVPMFLTGQKFPLTTLQKITGIVTVLRLGMKSIGPFMSAIADWRAENNLPEFDTSSLFDPKVKMLGWSIGLDFAQSMNPNTFMVGPIIPEERKQLPAELLNFLENAANANERVVFLSLGSHLQYNEERGRKFYNALRDQKFKVVWSIRKHMHSMLPREVFSDEKFFVAHWVPQQTLLSHRAIRVFVTHGGANSVGEAIFFGVPLVVLPEFADQFDNAARVEHSGVGLSLQLQGLDESVLRSLVSQVFTDDSFKANAERVARIMKREGGVKRAVEVIDTLIDTGVDHLIPVDKSLAFWDRNNLDLLAIALMVLYIAWRLFASVLSCSLALLFSSKKQDSKQKTH